MAAVDVLAGCTDAPLCEALNYDGSRCGDVMKYGRLCYGHYTVAERDISKIVLVPA